MSKDELKETLFNTFPRRRQQQSQNNPCEMECILCKRQISVRISDHKCGFRVLNKL